jgi:hypothetical protein
MRGYLSAFAGTHGAQLLPQNSDSSLGYGLSAALGQADGGWVALLRDDVVVAEGWLDRLMQALTTDVRAAAVGPLTTAVLCDMLPASEQGAIVGDATAEPVHVDEIAAAAFRVGCWRPVRVSRLDGACLLLRGERRGALSRIDLRPWLNGNGRASSLWFQLSGQSARLLLAADVYVQTGAAPSVRGAVAQRGASNALGAMNEAGSVQARVAVAPDGGHPIALAAACGRIAEEIKWESSAASRNSWFEGRRLALLLPVSALSTGITVVLDQAYALRDLGVDAWIVRVGASPSHAEVASAAFQLPVLWARTARDVPPTLADTGIRFDAVVAVGMKMLEALPFSKEPICGCYLPAESIVEMAAPSRHHVALLGHCAAQGRLRLLAQVATAAGSLLEQLAVQPEVVGVSIDTTVFRPLPTAVAGSHAQRISVLRAQGPDGAQLSLGALPTPRRSRLGLSMWADSVLGDDLSRAMKKSEATDLLIDLDPLDLAMQLRRSEVFLDLSNSPLGEIITLAAMACGCAVIIACSDRGPEFARHEENALIVDRADAAAPVAAIARLVADPVFCDRLRRQAAVDAASRPHRRAALALASALFDCDREMTHP